MHGIALYAWHSPCYDLYQFFISYGVTHEITLTMIYIMVVFIYLHITWPHYHHHADLSEGIELLKCLSGSFCLECVSRIKSILSIIFHAIYVAVCIQLTQFFYDDCENMCTLSYYHQHQIGSMTHLPLFRVRLWNNGMRCMSFYILVNTFISHGIMYDIALTRIQFIEAEWRIYAPVNCPSLVQIMTCRLVGAKPLSEPRMDYC